MQCCSSTSSSQQHQHQSLNDFEDDDDDDVNESRAVIAGRCFLMKLTRKMLHNSFPLRRRWRPNPERRPRNEEKQKKKLLQRCRIMLKLALLMRTRCPASSPPLRSSWSCNFSASSTSCSSAPAHISDGNYGRGLHCLHIALGPGCPHREESRARIDGSRFLGGQANETAVRSSLTSCCCNQGSARR